MFLYDENKAAQLIALETGYDSKMSENTARQLKKINKALYPTVESWIQGKQIDFEFSNITLTEIMKKESASFIQAVFRMSVILDHPEFASSYKKSSFARK